MAPSIRGLVGIRPAEWRAMVAAGFVGLRVEYGLRRQRLPQLTSRLGIELVQDGAPVSAGPEAPGPQEAAPEQPATILAARLPEDAARQWRAVGRVMRHWPGNTGSCLRTTLVAGHRLRRLHPQMRMGLARIDGELQAHAWLEVSGRTLDPLGAMTFAPFTSLASVPRSKGTWAVSEFVASLYGLTVRSEIDLHQSPADANGEPDVIVLRGEPTKGNVEPPPGRVLVDHEYAADLRSTFTQLDDGGCLLRFTTACDLEVAPDLRTVRVHLAEGVDEDFASVLICGALLSFLLMMRGEPVLHASAVDAGGRVLAFVGYSGMGKSTMAALVAAQGPTLVTDDVLRLRLDPLPITCYRGPTELRLRKSATELAEHFATAPSVRVTSDARDALRIPGSGSDRLPLGAIVVPRPRRDIDQVQVVRLAQLPALLELVRYPRILGWEDREVQARQFDQLGTVVQHVPVYVADVPWGPPFAADIGARILAEVGLA